MKLSNIKISFSLLIGLLLVDCCISGYIGIWRNPFWNSVEQRHLHDFIYYLAIFSGVALISCCVSGKYSYLSNMIALNIRTNLTRKALKQLEYEKIEGGPQRVQEDCFMYPSLLISLITGFIRSIVIIGVYSAILISQVHWLYLLFPVGYAVIGTLFAANIAKPLINLNYINQQVEAIFRQKLSKLNYAKVHRNNYNLFKRTKLLAYFQSFYNQITVVIPYIILSGLYFSSKIAFGAFMQVASCMSMIIDNMSFMINAFNDINKFISCRKRLKEIQLI